MLAWCSFYSVTAPSGNTLARGRPERARTATTPHSGHGCGNSSSSHCSSFRSHAGSAGSWRNVASAAPPSKSDTFIPATRPLRERALVSLPGQNFPLCSPAVQLRGNIPSSTSTMPSSVSSRTSTTSSALAFPLSDTVQALRRQLRLLPRDPATGRTLRDPPPSPAHESHWTPSSPNLQTLSGNRHVISFEAAARSVCVIDL